MGSIRSIVSDAAYAPTAATGRNERANAQKPEGEEGKKPSLKPDMDQYIPEDKEGKAPESKKAESCRSSTDKVDREIEQLKKKKEELEQALRFETDETKGKELERKLGQVEQELRQKDNDAYRRQHSTFT